MNVLMCVLVNVRYVSSRFIVLLYGAAFVTRSVHYRGLRNRILGFLSERIREHKLSNMGSN